MMTGRLVGEQVATRRRLRTADLRWHPGLWLGRDEVADEHIVGTETGCNLTRSIRRRPEPDNDCADQIMKLRGAPKNPEMGAPRGRPSLIPAPAPQGVVVGDPDLVAQSLGPRGAGAQQPLHTAAPAAAAAAAPATPVVAAPAGAAPVTPVAAPATPVATAVPATSTATASGPSASAVALRCSKPLEQVLHRQRRRQRHRPQRRQQGVRAGRRPRRR